MLINIVPPKKIPYYVILRRTKKFYALKTKKEVVCNENSGFYIFLRRKKIQIKIVHNKEATIRDVECYLNYIFKHSYVGIQEKYFEDISLQGVEKIGIS